VSERIDKSAKISPDAGSGPHRVGLIAALSKGEARELADDVAARLESSGVAVIPERDLERTATGALDAIVVLGGDGLMMRTANAYPDVPLLGINFGNVGFLALVERRDWQPAIDALLRGDYTVQQGPTLQATLVRGGVDSAKGWAINDVVVRSGLRMVDVEIYIDGHYVNTYPGDGMIVATPHGSTAYCMAAGGPILTAGVRGFAIVPISCHSPIRTPFVVSEDALIELVIANGHEVSLILDGRESDHLARWDIVRVARGEHTFRLITLQSTNFYEAFRTKFNFRIRPDAVPSRPGLPTEPDVESKRRDVIASGGADRTDGGARPDKSDNEDSSLDVWLIDVLACPVDRGKLQPRGDSLVCTECGRVYDVLDGVPVMLPAAQETEQKF
jgi:NAD+ kinase